MISKVPHFKRHCGWGVLGSKAPSGRLSFARGSSRESSSRQSTKHTEGSQSHERLHHGESLSRSVPSGDPIRAETLAPNSFWMRARVGAQVDQGLLAEPKHLPSRRMANIKQALILSAIGVAAVSVVGVRKVQKDREEQELREKASDDRARNKAEYYRRCQFKPLMAELSPACTKGESCHFATSCLPPQKTGRPSRGFELTCDPSSSEGYRIESTACPEGQICRHHRSSERQLVCENGQWHIRPVSAD